MFGWFDGLFAKVMAVQRRWETDAVIGRVLRPWFVVLALTSVITASFLDGNDTPIGWFAGAWLVGWAGAGVSAGFRSRIRYRAGWFDGREALFASREEAEVRGLTVQQWLISEMERDTANLMGYRHSAPKRQRPRPLDGSHENIPEEEQ